MTFPSSLPKVHFHRYLGPGKTATATVDQVPLVPAVWRSLGCISQKELDLDRTLFCGQCFRWRKVSTTFWGFIGSSYLGLAQTADEVFYTHIDTSTPSSASLPVQQSSSSSSSDEEQHEQQLKRSILQYFSLHVPSKLTGTDADFAVPSNGSLEWSRMLDRCSKVDASFEKWAEPAQGVRLLQQDPYETLLSFICSANNNVNRIIGMIDRFATAFGERVAHVQLTGTEDIEISGTDTATDIATAPVRWDCYAFPSLDRLAEAYQNGKLSDSELRGLGFGYRAPSIVQTVEKLLADDRQLLKDLYQKSRLPDCEKDGDVTAVQKDTEQVLQWLMQFRGVGMKVASCVALFSMQRHDVVPVDTHIWQHSVQNYGVRGNAKQAPTLPQMLQVQQKWRELFGSYAGWAQMVVFSGRVRPVKRSRDEIESE